MQALKCPECLNVIPESNLNTETGLAKCNQCGHVAIQSDLVDAPPSNQGKGLRFEEYQPPESARHQVLKNENGVLQLYLPKAGFQLGTVFNVFSYVVMTLVFLFFSYIFLSTSENFNVFILVVPLLFIGIPAYRLATRINRATQTETLEINEQELKLNMRRPLGFNASSTFNLRDIQGAEFENEDAQMNKVGVKMPRIFIDNTRRAFYYRAFVITGEEREVFFMQEDPEAKEWLVNYLDNLVKNHQTKEA